MDDRRPDPKPNLNEFAEEICIGTFLSLYNLQICGILYYPVNTGQQQNLTKENNHMNTVTKTLSVPSSGVSLSPVTTLPTPEGLLEQMGPKGFYDFVKSCYALHLENRASEKSGLQVGQKVSVSGESKYRGKTGSVSKVGKTRAFVTLSVTSELVYVPMSDLTVTK